MKHFYKVYGLAIESEMLIDELSILEEDKRSSIDVDISFREITPDIKSLIRRGEIADYKYDNMWFYIKNTAIFQIVNGKNVYIEPEGDINYRNIKNYILGSVLGMVMLQKNIVALHGGGIVINNQGCVFCGRKGAGKSTLSTSLVHRGYKFIADDVCAIKEGKINYGFPYHKLCEDTMTKLGYDTEEGLLFTSDDAIKKYIVPAYDEFVNCDVPFRYMFEICVGDDKEVSIEEVDGSEKLKRFIANIFKIEMLYSAGNMKPIYFKKCIETVKNIKFYKINRPRDIFSVDKQIKLVEDVILKNEEIC